MKPSTTKERFAWLQDAALEHPDWSIPKARAALKAKFGIALGSAIINDTLKAVRAAAGLPVVPTVTELARTAAKAKPIPVLEDEKLRDAVRVLRNMGVSSIEVNGETVRVAFRLGELKP